MVELKKRHLEVKRGRPCSVCNHIAVDKIEELIQERKPFQEISMYFNVSEQSLQRHRLNHMQMEIPRKGEMKAVWKLVDSGDQSSWSAYDAYCSAQANESVARLYLKQDLVPAHTHIILREYKGLSTFRII